MKAKKLPVGLRILFGFLSVILCVALFATSVLTIALADVRVLTNEDNLQVIISYVMFGTPVKKNAPIAPQAVGGMKLDETDSMPDAQQVIVDMLYEMLGDHFGEEVPFTQEEVGQLLEQSTLPEFLSEKMAGIMSDLYTGEITTTITGEEVAQLLEDNKELFQETFGVELSEEYKSAIVDKVNEMDVSTMVQNVVLGKPPVNPDAPEGGDSSLSGTNKAMETFSGGVINALLSGKGTIQDIFNGGISVMLMAAREVTSVNMLLMLLGACLVLIALLFVVNMKQLHMAVRYVGVTTTLAALPFAAATVVAFVVPSLFSGALYIAYMALTLTAGVSIGVLVGGLALTILSVILTVVYKKNLKTPVAVVVEAPVEVVPEMPVLEEVAVTEEAPVVEEVPAVEEMSVMDEVAPVELPTEEAPVAEV